MERTRSPKAMQIRQTSPQPERIVVTFPSFQIAHYILITLLIVSAFLLGNLSAKVKFLESGSKSTTNTATAETTVTKPAAKYSSFDDALSNYGKSVKIDSNKFTACISSGDKKSVVEADATQGSSFGVQGTPAFFINGKFLGGAFPFEAFKDIIDKELAGTGSTNAKDYIPLLQQAFDSQPKSFDPTPKNVDIGNAPIKGPGNAKVTIIEFSDFQCPYCKRGFETISQVLKEYDGKVRLVFKQFPLNAIHPKAQKAAEASVCATDQNKFWEFHDILFQNQEEWSSL